MGRIIKDGDRQLAGRNVRLIGNDGSQLGVMPLRQACQIAQQNGLDLVAVAEQANPPVCKIMDFGKYIYEQKKKEKEQKKHQHAQKQKEIKFSASIDQHDYQIKINHAIEFLKDEHKVKATMMFRGRELSHKEIGFNIMNRVVEDLAEYGTPEAPPKLIGKSIIINFNPK